MQDKGETSELPESPFANVSVKTSGAQLYVEHKVRPSRFVIAILTVVVLAGAAAAAYFARTSPPTTDATAWTPPKGLSREETPDWLRTLCSDRTPELCAAADRARTSTECPAIRAALKKLNTVQNQLSERGQLSAGQRYVLIELYGQGEELCPKGAVE